MGSWKKRIILTLALCAGMATLGQGLVTATGTAAVLKGDAARARDRAVESALRSAVEQVVGTMVDSESLVQNNALLSDKIFTQTRGYVSEYRILSEKNDPDTNIYSVKVEAKVKRGDLTHDLRSLGLLMRRMNMPRVAVAIDEDGETAADTVLGILKKKGFLVMDTGRRTHGPGYWDLSSDDRVRVLRQYGAEVAVLGSATASQGGTVGGSNMVSYQASVSLKALKTDSHELIAAANGTGRAVHVGEAGAAKALAQASTVAANALLRQITRQWSRESSSNRMIALEVRHMGKTTSRDIAMKLLRYGRGIKDVMIREYSEGRGTFTVAMQGDASTLAQEIAKIYPSSKVVSQNQNRLTVSF